jgi:hypothetical protein
MTFIYIILRRQLYKESESTHDIPYYEASQAAGNPGDPQFGSGNARVGA